MFESLGIDWVSLLWQIVAFIGLIFLLNMLLYRPIRRTLDERARRIQESMEEAERAKQQAIRADEQYNARLGEAQTQAQCIVDEAREQARRERERILEEAQRERDNLLQEARAQIELERRDAAREARRQVAGLAVLAAGRLIGESLDTEKHRRLVEQHIAALEEPLEELRQAVASVPAEKIGTAHVRSAVPLTEETQAAIRARLAGALGREVPVVFGTDPRLLGGFALQLGDQVIDLSVARKLSDLFRETAV